MFWCSNPLSESRFHALSESNSPHLSKPAFYQMTEGESFSLILELLTAIRKVVGSSMQSNVRRYYRSEKPFKRILGQSLKFLRDLSGKDFLKKVSSTATRKKAHSLLGTLFAWYYQNDRLRVQIVNRSSTGYFAILRSVLVLLNKICDPNTIELNLDGHDDCYQKYYASPWIPDWPGYKQERRNCPANHAFTPTNILSQRSWQFVCWNVYHSDLDSTLNAIFLPERANEVLVEALQQIFGPFKKRSLRRRGEAAQEKRNAYAKMQVEAIKLCKKKSLSYGAIAKKVGTTGPTVRNWCLKAGIRTAKPYQPEPPRQYLPELPIKHRAKKSSKYQWKFCPYCQNKLEINWKCCPYCGKCRNPSSKF